MRLTKWGVPAGRALAKIIGVVGACMTILASPALAALSASIAVPTPFSALIYPGDITAFRITLANSNTGAAVTAVDFTDTMPGGLIVAGAGVTGYSCVDGNGAPVPTTGTVSATVGTNVISLTGGTVPKATLNVALGQCSIDVQVTSQTRNTAPQNLIPAGSVTGTDDSGAVSNAAAAGQTITVRNLALPEISKSFSPTSVPKGGTTTTLTITISNAANASTSLPLNGAGDTPGYAIRDALPANIVVAAAPGATSTCTGSGTAPAFSPAAGDPVLQAVGGVVAAGGTCTLTVKLAATAGATDATTFANVLTNTISASGDFHNTRGLIPAASATADLTVTSGLTLLVAYTPATVAAGQTANFFVRITNTGQSSISLDPVNALTIPRIDGLAAGTAYGLIVQSAPTSCSGIAATAVPDAITGDLRGVSFAGGTIAAGANCLFSIPYRGVLQTAGTPQSFGVTVPVGALKITDPSVTNPQASASVNVIDQLTIAKTVSPSNPGPGAPVRYSVEVRNYTGSTLTDVKITDALPGGMTALSAAPYAPALSGMCTGVSIDVTSAATPVVTVASFGPGAAPNPSLCTVTFWAKIPDNAAKGAVFTNTLGAGTVVGTSPGGPVGNSGSSTVNAAVIDAIAIEKAFAVTSAPEGTVVPLTITLRNASSNPTTSAAFTDTFPLDSSPALNGNRLIVANPANASTTCAGGTLTATPGATSINLSGATIPARGSDGTSATLGSCSVTVSVVGGAGVFQNTLPAGTLTGTQQPADGGAPIAKSAPGPITSTLNYTAALAATKAFAPLSVSSGGTATVTIHLENVGGGTLSNVVVTDPLPAGMTVAPTPNAYSTCGGSPTVTAAAGSSVVTMEGAVVPAGGQCNLLFDVRAVGASAWTNTIPAGGITANGGVRNVTPISNTLNNVTTSGVTVSMTILTYEVPRTSTLTAPGQVAELTISLENSGAVSLTGLGLTNHFTVDGLAGSALLGMVVAGAPAASTTCTGGLVSTVAGGTSIGLSNASLPAGATCTIKVNVTLTRVTTVINQIPIGQVTTSQGVTNALAASSSLDAGANLGISKVFLPAVIQPGTTSRLRITVINSQAVAASQLAFVDTLPVGVVVAPTPNASTTCAGGAVSATAGGGTVGLSGGTLLAATLGSSTLCLVEVDVTAAAAGTYVNTIPKDNLTGQLGGSLAKNPVPASATLQVRLPVTIAKAFAQATRAPGQPDAVTLTLTNPNAVPLTSAALTDNLPSNLTVALVPNAGTTCAGGTVAASPSATSVVLTGGTIPASGSCTITFDVVSNTAGVYVNTIPAGGLGTAEGVTNEVPVSATVTVFDPPTVSKQFTPVAIPAGGVSTLSIVLGNPNAIASTLTSALVDSLPTSPGAILVAPAPNVGGTCTTASVTAVAGAATVTYANGATIPAGGCTITVDVTGSVEGNYVNTIPAGALKTTLGNNLLPANAPLTITPLGYISGRVYRDNDADPAGAFTPGDTGIAGVTVTLTGTDFGADGVAGGGDDTAITPRTTTTDSLGNYAFTSLNAGSYTVTEPTQPAGTNNGKTLAGTLVGPGTPGAPTAQATVPSAIADIVLGRSGTQVSSSPNNNFGEIVPSSIAGIVFLDQNNDGLRDLADTALTNVTVQLLSGGVVVATVVTDGSGAYSFTNLAPGTYTVREPTQPAGTANGLTVAGTVPGGTPGTVTLPAVVPSEIAGIGLPPATASAANNFAERPTGRQISGRVFLDQGNDGTFNGADTPLANVPINLSGTDVNGFPVTAAQVTDADGRYVFSGLAEGNYTVTEPTQPAGTQNGLTIAGSASGVVTLPAVVPSAISAIPLTGATMIASGNDFAEIPAPAPPAVAGTVSGKVYVDANDDGIPDASEAGIAGVVVTLTGKASNGADVLLTTTTGADGTFTFTNVPASDPDGYTLTETQPAAYLDGKTTLVAGSIGSPISVKPVVTGAGDIITGVVLSPGGSATGYQFGERNAGGATGTISGFVYVDGDNDGVMDAGETPIAGVTVRLTGKDSTGATVDRTVTTGTDGAYVFANLKASDAAGYTITQVQPAGYTDGKTSIAAGNPGTASATKPVAAGGSDVIGGVVFPAGAQLAHYDFGERTASGQIAGYVYVDANNNGVKDAGEAGIPGVTILLTGTAANGSAVSLAQVTDADGAFRFTNVPASDGTGYRLTEMQPTGYKDGKTTVASGNPGSPASGKPVNVSDEDRINGIVAGPNANLVDYAFGETGIPTLKPPIINGYVWFDRTHTRVRPTDGSVDGQAGWTVTLRQNGTVICVTTTDSEGFYQFDNLHCPGYEASGLPTGSGYSISFTKDGNALPNVPTSGGGRGAIAGNQIVGITLHAADQVVEQNLPLDPAGVVYDSVTRQPIPGAVVSISGPAGFDPATMLVGGLLAQAQTVGTDGLYQFLLQNAFPTGVYTLTVTAPPGYLPAPSTALPACANTLNVGASPNPALIQASDFAPGLSVTQQLNPNTCPGLVAGGSATTQYYFRFVITNGTSAPILNNHIPLDPIQQGALFVTKTTPLVNVSRGGLVPYTITATNRTTATIANIRLRDVLPPGFKLREGSATENGRRVTPVVENGQITWPQESFAPSQKNSYTVIGVVGAGVGDGDYVNRAFALGATGTAVSNTGMATVRLVPDPTFDCPDVIGRVFDDKNANGYQDQGEPGIPAVRMATADGLLVTSDADGRFHVPCPQVPNADRGSNFVMKLDVRSLPSGFRVTTENPRDVRITRGKLVKLDFGATVHRVVRIELKDAAFAPGSTELVEPWKTQLAGLPDLLDQNPSIVRIAYDPGSDPQALVRSRKQAVMQQIREAWRQKKGRYSLSVELEEAR